jgi:hypothetical protein
MNRETATMRNIQKAVTVDGDTRLFRNTVGQAFQGRLAEIDGRRVLLDPRPIKFGLVVGSSDLIGWRSVVVTPEMVGQRIALFAAIEVKEDDGGDGTEGQTRFLEVVKVAGGISGIARNPEQAFEVLRGKL